MIDNVHQQIATNNLILQLVFRLDDITRKTYNKQYLEL